MRHKVVGKTLGRHLGARNALRRVMVAKRALATDDAARIVHARRLVNSRLADDEIVRKLFDEIAPRYTERNGGYTRMLKLGRRDGDSSEMVILELVE
jgi:ribosomal protein L17